MIVVDDAVTKKETFRILLFSIFITQFLRSCTLVTWGNLFRHEVLMKHPVIVETAIKFLKASMNNLVRVSRSAEIYSYIYPYFDVWVFDNVLFSFVDRITF